MVSRSRALTFPRIGQEYMGNKRGVGNRRPSANASSFRRFVTLHFARFIEATIARRKVIVIGFNHDDVRGALAAHFRDTAR